MRRVEHNVLITGVPDETLAAIDAKAARLGLTRAEYLRRLLARERVGVVGPVTVEALERAASLAQDLGDPGVMAVAWA